MRYKSLASVLILMSALFVTSCRSSRVTKTNLHSQQNSTQIEKIVYDSIIVRDTVRYFQRGDTILIEKIISQDRKVYDTIKICDTVQITDTINITKTKIEYVEKRSKCNWKVYLIIPLVIVILLFLPPIRKYLKIVIKLIRK